MDDPFLTAFHGLAIAEGADRPGLERPMAQLADALGRVVPAPERPRTTLPVVDEHLAATLAAGVGPVADLARMIAPRTSWAAPYPDYAGEPDMDAMRLGYAYSSIIGAAEDAASRRAVTPVYLSDEVFAGMVLQGPGITYPSHAHKAVEVYWAITGSADWQKGDEWSTHGPGSVILHETGVRHATITHSEPQLLFFAWVTDPACVPVIIRL